MIDMREPRQAGFILTLESVLIFTILGIGIIVGVIAVRDALFKKALSIQNENFYVFDSRRFCSAGLDDTNQCNVDSDCDDDPIPGVCGGQQSIAIGKVIGFDEHEAPWVPFIDYDPNGNDDPDDDPNYRALIGIRDDRFTSRQPIFYPSGACAPADGCIAGPSDEVFSRGVDNILTTGSVGYLYGLQGITYGIGATGRVDDPGTADIDESLVGGLYRQGGSCPAGIYTHAWNSQRVVNGTPCTPLVDEDGNPVSITVTNGGNELYDAVSVDANGANVLDALTPPFWTNMVSKPPILVPLAPSSDENTPMPPPP